MQLNSLLSLKQHRVRVMDFGGGGVCVMSVCGYRSGTLCLSLLLCLVY